MMSAMLGAALGQRTPKKAQERGSGGEKFR